MTLPRLAAEGDAVVLAVRAAPGSSRDRVMGVHAGALKVAVAAAPEKGKANRAIIALLAKALGVPRSRVVLRSGETSRDKTVLILGATMDVVREKLRALLEAP
ncbi:MAG: DUF167 domain-containing protein [Planctomycetes bacterium]|nr:DUF167 domain-containing protein [Planctomycetota bacterium]